MRILIRIALAMVGAASFVPLAGELAIAPDQIGCGLNPFVFAFYSGLCTLVLYFVLLGWRQTMDAHHRFNLRWSAIPWIAWACLCAWLLLLVPACPFAAR